jgi:hypothetical protein
MKNLIQADGDTSLQMNVQDRVIQSGLDSIPGDDAEQIIVLFKAFAGGLFLSHFPSCGRIEVIRNMIQFSPRISQSNCQ